SAGEPCEHGAFSPRVRPNRSTSVASTLDEESDNGSGGRFARDEVHGFLGDSVGDTVFGDGNIFTGRNDDGSIGDGEGRGWADSWSRWWGARGDSKGRGGKKTMTTSRWLAEEPGVRNKRRMYVSVYSMADLERIILSFRTPFTRCFVFE
ncbi:MAG: hypothetical protein Q9211_007044, partial [Gyalolechia sp. 1 TL-2023]